MREDLKHELYHLKTFDEFQGLMEATRRRERFCRARRVLRNILCENLRLITAPLHWKVQYCKTRNIDLGSAKGWEQATKAYNLFVKEREKYGITYY